jgi:hypothetical protein
MAVQLASIAAPKSTSNNTTVYGRCHRDNRRVVRIQAFRGTPLVTVGGWISKLSTWRTVLLRVVVLVTGRWRSVVTSLASSVLHVSHDADLRVSVSHDRYPEDGDPRDITPHRSHVGAADRWHCPHRPSA